MTISDDQSLRQPLVSGTPEAEAGAIAREGAINRAPTLSEDEQGQAACLLDWSNASETADCAGLPEDEATWVLPVIKQPPQKTLSGADEACIPLVRSLISRSGTYALAAIVVPLISLIMQPLLTRWFSPGDYGVLAVLNTLIALLAGITQLGLGTAFLRAYHSDYTGEEDRRGVLATVTTLLLLSSFPLALGIALLAPWLTRWLSGGAATVEALALVGLVVLLQNMTVPGYAWLRAEGHAGAYVLLAIVGALITLGLTLLLIPVLHLGLAGSLLATAGGYGCIVLCFAPRLLRTGLALRRDIVRNVLTFGLPLMLSFVSYWVLQLSDRFLLGLFSSFEQTAKYAIAYNLGSLLSTVLIGPFNLAWPSVMFTLAKRDDAVPVFRALFWVFSLLLLFAAFGLSLAGVLLLQVFFPPAYTGEALIIPLVAGSLVFYGIYFIFMLGANIRRKTWQAAAFTGVAALLNLALNLALIPRYGAPGAALATLLAYIALALLAYIANQRLYPIPFSSGVFALAFGLGVLLYTMGVLLTRDQALLPAWGIRIALLSLYGLCLLFLGRGALSPTETLFETRQRPFSRCGWQACRPVSSGKALTGRQACHPQDSNVTHTDSNTVSVGEGGDLAGYAVSRQGTATGQSRAFERRLRVPLWHGWRLVFGARRDSRRGGGRD